MIKEELRNIIKKNEIRREKEESESLRKQQEEQEKNRKWEEENQELIESKIEQMLISMAKKSDENWIKVKIGSSLLMCDSNWKHKITDKQLKAYCKKHRIKFRYWYEEHYKKEVNDVFYRRKPKDDFIISWSFLSIQTFKGYAIRA